MRTSDPGSGTRGAALGIALLAGTVAALAQITPYDFTGQWTGSATQTGKSPVALAADFTTGTKPNTFTGTLTVTSPDVTVGCTVHGRQKPHQKVKIRLTPCGDHSMVLLRGTLDPTAATITGRFMRVKRGKVKGGTFTLTRGASPSGAFLDDPERSAP